MSETNKTKNPISMFVPRDWKCFILTGEDAGELFLAISGPEDSIGRLIKFSEFSQTLTCLDDLKRILAGHVDNLSS